MLSGFFTAASGILTQERKLAVISNNIANSKTPGYHAQRAVATQFDHELMVRMENGREDSIQTATPMYILEEVFANMEQGGIEGTTRYLDMAIEGEGFFNILMTDAQGEEQTAYTRNGNFDIDDEGYLVLRGAGRVLGQKGELLLRTDNFGLEPNGDIYVDGEYVDTLELSIPPQDEKLRRYANGLYVLDNEDAQMLRAAQYNLHPQSLERSNVDFNKETALLIETQRAFQACSAALKIVDDMNQKAASKIAVV